MTKLEKCIEAESNYQRTYSKPRGKQSLIKLLKNGSYILPEKEENIVAYMINNKDVDYPHLVEMFNIPRPILERLRAKNNLPAIKKKNVESFQKVLLLESKRKCPSCQCIKPLSEWYTNNLSRCIECEKLRGPIKLLTKQKKNNSSLENYLNNKLVECKQRKKLPTCTLTLEDLLGQYSKQEGLCYYSGRVMELALKTDTVNSLSIDRIDSRIGYNRDNIVLCCSIVNFMKQEYPVELFLKMCNEISLLHPLEC